MAATTLYKFRIDVADVDRSTYEALSLRVAQHPSEDLPRLVARVLAYCLVYEPEIEFGRGLSDVEEPAIWLRDPAGRVLHWVDIGQPSAERIHRASKAAEKVSVVCHRSKEGFVKEARRRVVHHASEIAVHFLPSTFVAELAERVSRNDAWSFVRTGSDLQVNVGDAAFSTTLDTTNWERVVSD